jgi:hypothetical protein
MQGKNPRSACFATNAMSEAMKLMEVLRTHQRNGDAVDIDGNKVSFITMCSEHPDSVGHPGVDVTGPDYDWKKRRI